MKSKIFLIIFLQLTLFCFIKKVNAQTPDWLWAKSIGGNVYDAGNSIVLDSLGNVYTTGRFYGTVDFDPSTNIFNLTSAGSWDIFISKLDGFGNFVWAKALSGSDYEEGISVVVDASGNVYSTGFFRGAVDFDPDPLKEFYLSSDGGADIFISKLDASGNFVWAKQIGGLYNYAEGASITVDALNNVYTTGYFFGTVDFDPGQGEFFLESAGPDHVFISKLNSSGNFVWAKTMGGIGTSRACSLKTDAFCNIYIAGSFSDTIDFDPSQTGTFNLTSAGSSDIFVSKLDSSGNFLWAKSMGGKGYEIANSMVIDTSGNVFTTGHLEDTSDFDPSTEIFDLIPSGGYNTFISKLDSSGNFSWAKQIGGFWGYAEGYAIAIDDSSNVYTAGYFQGEVDFDPGYSDTFNLASYHSSDDFSGDIFISKLNSSGNFIWAKDMGGTSDERCQSIAVDGSRNVYVTGGFSSPSVEFGSTTLLNADVTGKTPDIFIAKLDNKITGIEVEENNSSVTVYPNPVNDRFLISYSKFQVGEIEVCDLLGRKLFAKPVSVKQTEVDVSDLPSGIYLLSVKSKDGTAVKKFIKS